MMECYLNVWLTILAILTTVLIGWQIFAVLSLESRLRRIRKQLTEQYLGDMHKLKYDATGMSLAQTGLALCNLKNFGGAFAILINALYCLSRGSDDEYTNEAKTESIRVLNEIAETPNIILCKITPSEKDFYITIAGKINSAAERERILKLILNAEIIEADGNKS